MYKDLEKWVRKDIPYKFNELKVLKKHFSRVINIYNNVMLPPYEILIHPSSICNLSCEWCIGSYVANKNNSSNLLLNDLNDVSNMRKIVRGIVNYKKFGINYDDFDLNKREFKVERVSFSGITGEPLVSKKSLVYAIEELTNHGIEVGLFTNGTLITRDIYSVLLKMDYILISMDAGSNDVYSKLKCSGKDTQMLSNLINTIKELSIHKKKINSNTDINIGYVINKHNYNEIYDLAIKLKESGVHYFRFKTDISSLMQMTNFERIEAERQIDKVEKELTDEYFSVVKIHKIGDEDSKKRNFSKCFIHYLIGNISADGNVYPCNYHPKPSGVVFDSALKNDFSLIWDNMLQNTNDSLLPTICPKVCDPFKNRANKLLEVAYEIYKTKGIEYLKKCIEYTEKKVRPQ